MPWMAGCWETQACGYRSPSALLADLVRRCASPKRAMRAVAPDRAEILLTQAPGEREVAKPRAGRWHRTIGAGSRADGLYDGLDLSSRPPVHPPRAARRYSLPGRPSRCYRPGRLAEYDYYRNKQSRKVRAGCERVQAR